MVSLNFHRLAIDNKYMIFGPGRTGSKFIVDLIKHTYHKNKLPCKYFDPSSKIEDLPKHFFVWHHHSIENYLNCLNSEFRHITKILSTRNMIESTYSWAIVNRTQKFHVFHDETLDVVPFYLPEQEFLFTYNNIVSFYDKIKPILTDDTLVIDYVDYCVDNDYILNLLDLPKMPLDSRSKVPKKNPYSYKNCILNYEELEMISANLNKFPNLK